MRYETERTVTWKLHPSIMAETATLTHCCRSAERTYVRNVELSVRTYEQRDIANYVRTYVRTYARTYVRAYMST